MRQAVWLILVIPLATGAGLAAEFVSGHAHFTGETRGFAAAGAVLLHPDLAPAEDRVVLDVDEGELLVLRTSWATAGLNGEPDFYRHSQPEELLRREAVTGRIVIEGGAATHFRLLAEAESHALVVPVEGRSLEARLGPDIYVSGSDQRGIWNDAFDRPAWPVGATALLRGAQGPTEITEKHAMFARGGVVTLPSGERIDTGTRTLANSAGPVKTEAEELTYVIIKASFSRIEWGVEPVVLAYSTEFHHDGSARFVKADGSMRLDDEEIPRERQLLILNGSFSTSIQAGRGGHAWRLAGEVDEVAIDGVPILRAEWPLAVTGLAAAGLLWLIAHALLRLAQFLSSGRVLDPLQHPKRTAILQTLTEKPGQSIMQLAQRHNLSRSSIRYHTGMLVAAGLLSEYREGKIPRYALNSGSSRFIQDGVPAAKAFAAMAHPVRGAIITQAEQGPLTYHDFCQAEHEIAQRTFQKHCQILAEAGLLGAMREGQTRAWHLEADIAALKQHYVRSYEVRQGRAGPASFDDA